MKSKQTSSKKLLSPFISPFLSPSYQRPQNDLSMDWSSDISEVQDLLQQCVSPTSEHICHLMFYYIIWVQTARTEQNLLLLLY